MSKISSFFTNIRFAPNLAFWVVVDLIILFSVLSFGYNFIVTWTELSVLTENGNEFSLLADGFLHGRLDLSKYPGKSLDCSLSHGRCFWALGPWPAVLLLPFVGIFKIFSAAFYQGYMNFFLGFLVLWLCYRLAKKLAYSQTDALWLALTFTFGSIFIGCLFRPLSWYFSQTVAVALIFLALAEWQGKKRHGLIGLCLALCLATRLTAALGVIFFLLDIIFSPASAREKAKALLWLLAPLAASGLLLGLYNYARFGSFWETGYGLALVGWAYMAQIREQYGLFNPAFFLTNLYYYFFKTLEPVLGRGYFLVMPYFRVSPLGLSFFIISPIFLRIFWADHRERAVKFSWAATFPVLAVLLCYYNSGAWQFGPRYMLDFLPFWYLLLLYSFKDRCLHFRHYALITASVAFDLVLYLNF